MFMSIFICAFMSFSSPLYHCVFVRLELFNGVFPKNISLSFVCVCLFLWQCSSLLLPSCVSHLSLSLSLSVSTCVNVCFPEYLSFFLCVSLYDYIHLHLLLFCVSVCVSISVCVSQNGFASFCVYISVYLCMYIYVCLSICLSVTVCLVITRRTRGLPILWTKATNSTKSLFNFSRD